MSPRKKEEEYYRVVEKKLDELFREKNVEVYWEITARGTFSDCLKSKIPSGREVIFLFLKKAAPDITGFIEKGMYGHFVVVEVKKDKINLDDIYQLKKYADLFEARFAFLISLKPIPDELKRLHMVTLLLGRLSYNHLDFALTQFDETRHEFTDWFEKNPFDESTYWIS